jgi:5-formyltetrahydrofolate cyclo-ligase
MSGLPAQKQALRAQLRSALASLTAEARAVGSSSVVARIRDSERWRRARVVMVYVPVGRELDLLPLVDSALDHHKTVLVPRFNATTGTYEPARVSNLAVDLVRGPFGVPEPSPDCAVVPLNQLDVTLVPGLGFDRAGRRLGRGKGHYDRLLAHASGEFWGIGHDCQLIAEVPGEAHDVVLNCIVTPAHWVEVVSARR